MKHVMVMLNEETKKLDIVLRWPIGSPIGPRLEKRHPMPEYPSVGYVDPEEALGAAASFDQWLTREEQGDVKEKKPEPTPVKKEETIMEPEKPKVIPPAPKPRPKQSDMFGDL